MHSSSDLLREFTQTPGVTRDPGFAVIVAFDYYDGPERGLALYPSGDGVRFSSLGDSKSRLFRAFELIPIRGDWWPAVKALHPEAGIDSSRLVLVPKASDVLTRLESEVLNAPATGFYVGVGSPNFEQISVSAVTAEQLETLRQLGCLPAGFRSAHQLVKHHVAKELKAN
jgi:hypothetical protein